MKKSLYNQTYTNWKALWIGEQDLENDKIKEVAVKDKKELSEIYLRDDVLKYISDCDYVVKLDDDDIILPDTLEIASYLSFDMYCDRFHTFYDITSGTVTQQERSWIASTCIHKKEHAFLNRDGKELAHNFIHSLFYGEHGKDWISYYKNKNIVYANPKNPVYVRVLSPTSITAGAKKFPVKSIEDIDMKHYYTYLKQFGVWRNIKLNQFELFGKDLSISWFNFSNLKQSPIQGITFFEKVKAKLKTYLK
ncbi:MAG: hypothetical protein JNM51_10710 [Bacteroidia bacterium]|nr:hypothetical protein [Bacteroidia bacterium]